MTLGCRSEVKQEVGSSALHRPSLSDGVWILSERSRVEKKKKKRSSELLFSRSLLFSYDGWATLWKQAVNDL